jgi:cytochrome b subunit of formate dehydrogenase
MQLRVRLICQLASVLLSCLLLLPAGAGAQDLDCAACHEPDGMVDSVHAEVACGDCHTNITDRRHARGDVEPLGDEMCAGCHRRENREVSRSIHGGNASCVDCHGAPHDIRHGDDLESAMSPVNQIKNCGTCHNEPESLIDGYLTSVHGRGLLRAGLIDSASCSDCHGAHGIESVDAESAPTAHANSPEMCGQCHSLLLEEWKTESAHGLAWQADNAEAPVCTDCHSSHEIIEPTSATNRLASAETCGGCHDYYLQTFRDSFHGKANELGFVEGANCSDCHTPHKNLGADDPRSTIHADNLEATCGSCHEGVTASILSFNPHSDPKNPDDNFKVFVVWVFMTGLLIGVFAFFGLHDALWLQRSIVGVMRGEFKEPEATSGQYVRRFTKMNIRLHLTIIVTFLLLALTGLPLKFADAGWAQALMTLLGGVESANFIHRIAAIGTFGYALFHLGNIFYRLAITRERGLFWGPNSMVPQPKDIMDVLKSFRYFLYLGDRPANDRWNYIEKFDYLAVFWGVMIIGMSGLFLWFPMFFTQFVPGWFINAAYVIHSDEALLATGFIFIFHFFHTHLRPESFPMDIVVFTGKMSLERFKEERPLEYQRILDNGELDDYLVPPPTAGERRRAYVWGTLFLSVGVLLAIGIIWALLTH